MALLEHWHPVTSDMGLIRADRNRIVGSAFFREVFSVQRSITSSLSDALLELPPLSAEKKRSLLVSTDSGWTAYFSSGIQGSDPFPVVSSLARELRVMSMRVCSTPPGARYAANIWEVYAPQELGGIEPLGYRRSIASANDGGRWTFEESGDAFEFEDQNARTALRKRDRFTRAHLERYAAELGARPFDESFYRVEDTSPAILLTRQVSWEQRPPEFSLAEVRLGVPWGG